MSHTSFDFVHYENFYHKRYLSHGIFEMRIRKEYAGNILLKHIEINFKFYKLFVWPSSIALCKVN